MKKLLKIQKNAGTTHSMFTQCHPEYSRGTTYVELIVVLAIFAVMSSIVLFNYPKFQAKVDIKSLASDIALQIVQAQKSSLSGTLSSHLPSVNPWKPAYGVYFSSSGTPDVKGADSKDFIYFTDLDQDGIFDGNPCNTSSECLNKITITKGNTISGFTVNGSGCPAITNLTVLFKRTDYSAKITSSSAALASCGFSYVQINITSPQTATAVVKIYPSGRIQIN